jgi:hypothetical protein
VKSTVSIPPVSSAAAADSDRKRYVGAWLLCPRLLFDGIRIEAVTECYGSGAWEGIWNELAFLLAIPLRETGKAHVST